MCALKSSGALLQDCFFIRPGLPAVSFVSISLRSPLQGKCKVRAESSSLELCRTAAFARRCNLFASAKVSPFSGVIMAFRVARSVLFLVVLTCSDLLRFVRFWKLKKAPEPIDSDAFQKDVTFQLLVAIILPECAFIEAFAMWHPHPDKFRIGCRGTLRQKYLIVLSHLQQMATNLLYSLTRHQTLYLVMNLPLL